MSEIEIREWLDKLVEATTALNDIQDFNSDIHSSSENKYIPLLGGFDIVADIINADVVKEDYGTSDDGEIRIHKSFEYNGFEFWDIEVHKPEKAVDGCTKE